MHVIWSALLSLSAFPSSFLLPRSFSYDTYNRQTIKKLCKRERVMIKTNSWSSKTTDNQWQQTRCQCDEFSAVETDKNAMLLLLKHYRTLQLSPEYYYYHYYYYCCYTTVVVAIFPVLLLFCLFCFSAQTLTDKRQDKTDKSTLSCRNSLPGSNSFKF